MEKRSNYQEGNWLENIPMIPIFAGRLRRPLPLRLSFKGIGWRKVEWSRILSVILQLAKKLVELRRRFCVS